MTRFGTKYNSPEGLDIPIPMKAAQQTGCQSGRMAQTTRASDCWRGVLTKLTTAGSIHRGRSNTHKGKTTSKSASVPPRCVRSMCMLAGDCKCFCYLLSFAAATAAVPVELSAFAHAAACAYCCKRSLRCIWFFACPINLVRMLTSRCCNCTIKVKAMRSCCHCSDRNDLVKGQEALLPPAN